MGEQMWHATGYAVPQGNGWRFPKVHLVLSVPGNLGNGEKEKTLCGRYAFPAFFETRYKVDCRVCLRVAKRKPPVCKSYA